MSFPVNIAAPEKRESMIPNPELSIRTPMETGIEDDHQLPQGIISISQSEGPSVGNMYPTPQCPGTFPGPESMLGVVERVGSISGTPVEITAVSISASNSNIPMHEYAASAISGESNSIPNTAIHIGASEQSSQRCSLKGRGLWFYLVLQVPHSHRDFKFRGFAWLTLPHTHW